MLVQCKGVFVAIILLEISCYEMGHTKIENVFLFIFLHHEVRFW